MYNPDITYRCTIIRGKSQSDLEDLLPLYANMVHRICPCSEDLFKTYCRQELSKALFETSAYDLLSPGNRKTVDNHLTEIAGSLLGLYYPEIESDEKYIHESDSCRFLVENGDFPTFFKNLCLNFQFPNGAKWMQYITDDIANHIHIKPFCFVVALLHHAQSQKTKVLLTKQEVGVYVLNSLEVLQGKISPKEVYDQIMYDRSHQIKREKLFGSRDWQHIKEQFNLLELSNVVETDSTYIWLNKYEPNAISLFMKERNNFGFDASNYSLGTKEQREDYLISWKKFYGSFHPSLHNIATTFEYDVQLVGRDEQKAMSGAIKSTTDLGDEGEALVFRLEQDRIRSYKERLVNKVLLLGKTKGLGYDIASIEADEMPETPELARFIEVKATKRITEPSFDKIWSDSVNITSKEWLAAQQFGEHYNIYRVYFTKNNTIVVRIQNPFKLFKDNKIEVYPITYQMNFDSSIIEKRFGCE